MNWKTILSILFQKSEDEIRQEYGRRRRGIAWGSDKCKDKIRPHNWRAKRKAARKTAAASRRRNG